MNSERGLFTPVSFIEKPQLTSPPLVLCSSASDGHMGYEGGNENVIKFLGQNKIYSEQVVRIGLESRTNVSEIFKRVSGGKVLDQADAVIIALKGIYGLMTVGDCAPLILYDPKNQVISGVHTGWKGLAGWREYSGEVELSKPIILKTVNYLTKYHKSNPDDLKVYCGPLICGNHFEVKSDVATVFFDLYPQAVSFSDGNYSVDLKKVILFQLREAGVLKSIDNLDQNKIIFDGRCTFENDNLFSKRKGSDKRFAFLFGFQE